MSGAEARSAGPEPGMLSRALQSRAWELTEHCGCLLVVRCRVAGCRAVLTACPALALQDGAANGEQQQQDGPAEIPADRDTAKLKCGRCSAHGFGVWTT